MPARSSLAIVAVVFVMGCSSLGSASTSLDERLLGVWETEAGAAYTITAVEESYAMRIVDFDGEVLVVESLSWEEGALAWTYYVPSTNTRVSEVTTLITDNVIEVDWDNEDEKGVDALRRVR